MNTTSLFENRKRGVIALILIALAGCASGKMHSSAASTPDPSDLYTGRTVLFFDNSHGNQIEYYDPNGRSYLWYPGNRIALAGNWRLEAHRICTIYDSEYTFNPATGETGRNWDCTSFEQHRWIIRDTQLGDMFHLSTEQVPFILPAHPGYRALAEVK